MIYAPLKTNVRTKDEATILAMSKPMQHIGFNRLQIAGGTYNMIDKDGFHCAPSGGLAIVKTTVTISPEGCFASKNPKTSFPTCRPT
jgi:hypothetical protein